MEAIFNTILEYVIIYAPGVAALFGCIISFVKNKKLLNKMSDKFEGVRKKVEDDKNWTELKNELIASHKENADLKKKINELLTAIDRVQRGEE